MGSARPMLQVASVIGRCFGWTVLERVAEQAGRLDADLTQAQRADLVREVPAHLEREYDFKHVLVRDAAYATLLRRRRRVLHRRVAETLEQVYSERIPKLHAVLAYHYERAEAWPRAVEHARAAAEAARDGSANREAVESYTQALRCAEHADLQPGARGRLLEGRGIVYERLGEFEAAREDYEAALALAAPDDDVTRIRVLGALGMLWGGHKDYQRGADLTRQAADLGRGQWRGPRPGRSQRPARHPAAEPAPGRRGSGVSGAGARAVPAAWRRGRPGPGARRPRAALPVRGPPRRRRRLPGRCVRATERRRRPLRRALMHDDDRRPSRVPRAPP